MSGLPSDDHPVDRANEATDDKGPARIGRDSDGREDDQTLADADQTGADCDQTASDVDQAAADEDQAAADDDQAAADRDQESSDRDPGHGSGPDPHDLTRDIRERSTRNRRETARRRLEESASRDLVAYARDLAALARDRAAVRRDRELAAGEPASAGRGLRLAGTDSFPRAAENRARVAADRAAAAEARARAAADRDQAAADRDQAARDRSEVEADREALRHQLAIVETDAVTGTRTPTAGLAQLDHEIERARRTTDRLTVACVEVLSLQAVNDAGGQSAADALVARVAHTIRRHIRSYDLIVRLSPGRFLCVMGGAPIKCVRERLGDVRSALTGQPDTCEIGVGLAELAPQDSGAELIERAEDDLPPQPPPGRGRMSM